MKRFVLAMGCMLGAMVPGASVAARPAITVTVTSPTSGGIVGDVLYVSASVQTTYDIAEVTAFAGGVTVTLVRTGTAFTGTIPMASLPSGPYTLVVTATDVFGATGRAVLPVTLDRRPVLVVTDPLEYSVTRGTVAFQASCTDREGPCTLTATSNNNQSMTGVGTVSGTFDVSARNEDVSFVSVEALDSRGQTVRTSRSLYVELNPRWRFKQSVAGVIEDVTADRFLIGRTNVGQYSGASWLQAQILDRATGGVTDIPLPQGRTLEGSYQYRFAHLTPTGAIFVSNRISGTSVDDRVLDWNQGEVFDLGLANSGTSLKAAGVYATWQAGSNLYSRDLTSRTTTLVTADDASNNGRQPTDAGRLVYATRSSGGPFLYENGASTLFADGNGWWVAYEGDRIYYTKPSTAPARALWVDDESGQHLVTDNLTSGSVRVAGGWIAFPRLGNLGQTHIWLRSPTGTESQLTFFAGSAELEAVSPTGEVIYTISRRRYWTRPGTEPLDIGPVRGRIKWVDGEWTLSLGRTLLALTPTGVVASGETPEAAGTLRVVSAFPNPARSGVTVTYELPRPSTVHIWVVDALGRRVADLQDGDRPAGTNQVRWQADGFPSGTYSVVLTTDGGRVVTPVTVVR